MHTSYQRIFLHDLNYIFAGAVGFCLVWAGLPPSRNTGNKDLTLPKHFMFSFQFISTTGRLGLGEFG